jgi:hypothetical protein
VMNRSPLQPINATGSAANKCVRCKACQDYRANENEQRPFARGLSYGDLAPMEMRIVFGPTSADLPSASSVVGFKPAALIASTRVSTADWRFEA